MPDVYISYARQDADVARRVMAALSNFGVSTFIDSDSILPGEEWSRAITNAITSSRVLVLILSESSNRSENVVRETELAARNGLVIIPYRLDRVQPSGVLEYLVGRYQRIDATAEGSDRALTRAVLSAVERPPTDNLKTDRVEPAFNRLESRSLWRRIRHFFIGKPTVHARTEAESGVAREKDNAARLLAALAAQRLDDIGRVAFPKSIRSAAESVVADLPKRLEYVVQEAVQVGRLQDPGRQIEAIESALLMLSELKSDVTHRSGPMAEAVLETVQTWSDVFSGARDGARMRLEEQREIENPFIFGNPVQSLDANLFTGRRDVVLEIERNLVRAAQAPTLLLYGQRRMGKTSILNQLPNLLGPRFLPVLIDCQAPATVESQATLLRHLSRCLAAALNLRLGIDRTDDVQREARGVLDVPLAALQVEPYSAFEDWLDLFESRLPDPKVKVLLCLDEFERLSEILDRGWGTRFLDALRHWLQHRPRLSLMFVGSQTFEQLGPEWTNRFISARRLKVTFLGEDDVRQLLTKPTPTFNLAYSPEALQLIRETTNGQPFLTQVLASELVHHMNRKGGKRATPTDVKAAISDALERSADYFADIWYSRTEAERKLLREVARGARQPPTKAVARGLFEYDLLNVDGDFAVPIVGRWVREHHLND